MLKLQFHINLKSPPFEANRVLSKPLSFDSGLYTVFAENISIYASGTEKTVILDGFSSLVGVRKGGGGNNGQDSGKREETKGGSST